MTRFRLCLLLLLCLTASGRPAHFGIVSADEPQLSLPEASEEELNQVVVPLSEPVLRRIEEALRQQPQNGEIRSTGDPILDDVLDVIRRQGSVLEGSALDPAVEDRQPEPVPPLRPTPPRSLMPAPEPRDDEYLDAALQGPDARFYVAESLLKAARHLASLPGRDRREQLIGAMREQATMLLIDELSQNTD